jgi:hypothetical protein
MISAANQKVEKHPARGSSRARLRAVHPSAAALGRFARGEASREEGRQVVAHLLGHCPACARAVSGAARLTGAKDKK